MAIFNPQVEPGNADMPNYFKYSEPIKQPEADQSVGIALKTAGTALDGAAELADSTIKGIIKTDTYNRVDAERNSFTGFLDASKNPSDPNNGNPSSVGPDGPQPAPLNLLAGNTQSTPGAIQGSIDKISTIQAGLDGNKISETTYYQRLNSITKDLRATYPGYRDYIDSEVSKITGVTPANAYISSMIQDINRQSASQNKDKEYWQHKIVDNAGFPEADKMLQQYNQTGDSNKVMQWLNFNQGAINVLSLKKAAFEAQGQDRTTQQQKGEDYANSAAIHAATTNFYNSQHFTNGDMSAADIADKMTDLSLHPEKANDVAYQGLAERYAALHTQAYNQTMAILTRPTTDADGKYVPPVSDVIGADKVKSIVENSVGALFNKTREFIADKQFSPAYTLQNAATATSNNALFKIFAQPDIGGRVATASALNKAAPNLTPTLIGQLLGSGLDTQLSDFVKEQGRQAQAQTGGKYVGADGKLYSFKQSLDELDQAGNVRGSPIPGQAYNNLLEIRKAITDPTGTDTQKGNAIKYFYDSVNKGTMSKFMDDYYDSSRGGIVKGRTSAFAALTANDVTKSIWDYAQGHPADWQKYSNWAKGEFNTQLQSSVLDLNDAQNSQHFHIGYDSDNHKFTINNMDGSPLSGLQATPLNLPYRTVTNLNTGLGNLANIAKTEGSNVDAYLFKVLKDNGYTPSSKDGSGVPAQIMQSLIGAHSKPKPQVPVSE